LQADIVIKNAMIIDGTQKDRYKGSVFIKDGIITAIRSAETLDAGQEAEAKYSQAGR
jgi:N-acyl-D-aspartate/D-glutamate deacylase